MEQAAPLHDIMWSPTEFEVTCMRNVARQHIIHSMIDPCLNTKGGAAAVLVCDDPAARLLSCAIQVKDLVKFYGKVQALSGVNLDVKHGEIYGFLGPNGAGKTTTIRCMLEGSAFTMYLQPCRLLSVP